MIHVISIENSVGALKSQLETAGESLSEAQIVSMIEVAVIDARQVIYNLEPHETEKMLDDSSLCMVDKFDCSDPFEEFHFNVIEEIVQGFVRGENTVTLLDVSNIEVTNTRFIKVVTL